MIIQLPLENWADLLPFVPRRQLVEIVKQLGDRQFAKILQFFLTEGGQITFGQLGIVVLGPWDNDPSGCGGPIVEVRKEMPSLSLSLERPPSDLKTNLPEGPMPANVKDFKQIELSYFDESVANFLRQFQREEQQGNSLLDNVNLGFSSSISPRDDNTIMPILAQLMRMIGNGNINSMSIRDLHHMEFGRSGLEPNNAASQLLMTMLTNARILEIRDYMQMSTFPWCDWLYAPRNDGKPRALHLNNSWSNSDTQNLIEQVKKDFSMATHPVSFFVYVRAFFSIGRDEFPDICLDNGQTNERLVIKTIVLPPRGSFYYEFVLISRYPVGANQEWIEANEQEIMGWKFNKQNRQIRFSLGWKW